MVVACSRRKRIPPPTELRLSSIDAPPDERTVEWARRIPQVEVAEYPAHDLYVGDHWRSAYEAYRLAQQYSSRAELWVISAGYGLIASSKRIKPYSATFAAGAADSVWRGPSEGGRREAIGKWWGALEHEAALGDLVASRGDGAVVIAASGAYLAALDADLERALEDDAACDRMSVISAGARGDGPLLPVSGRFRAKVGGPDSSLNARLLALLAREAPAHRFSRSAMARMLAKMEPRLPITERPRGRSTSDREIVRHIQVLRRRFPGISRSRALQELRKGGIACEQGRFASIWESD